MTVPAFLSSSYYYYERTAVSDVQTIMDDFSAQVLANSPAWTNPSADLYQSPVDGVGRFFDVLLTRISQYKLELRLRDQNAVTVMTRRVNCPSANTWMVRIYTGQFHFCIDVEMGSAVPECLIGGILDMSPEAQNSHTHYVYGIGSRDTSDVLTGSVYWDNLFMVDNATPARISRCALTYSAYYSNIDTMGFQLFGPRMVWCQPTSGGNYKYAGRSYQAMIVGESFTPFATVNIPIDVGTTGQFKVIGGSLANPSAHTVLAIRIA